MVKKKKLTTNTVFPDSHKNQTGLTAKMKTSRKRDINKFHL